MKTIKKTAFIALGLLLSASIAQAIVESGKYAGAGAQEITNGQYRILPHGPVVVNPDKTAQPGNYAGSGGTYKIQPHGPVMVHPEGTSAQVGYQAEPGAYGKVPTSYQAPVAGTTAQVGYQAGTPAQVGYKAGSTEEPTTTSVIKQTGADDMTTYQDLPNTKAQGYIPPTVSEKDLK